MEDYKQKYEEALENIKAIKAVNKDNKGLVDFIEFKYPKLKESEDEKIRKALKSFFDSEISDYGNVEWRNGIRYSEVVAWLEKQDQKKHEEELENAYKCADEVQYRRGYEDAKREFESQGEQKPQGNSALEIWKDMRLEVYQQASGNRHTPNYSDDSTKMFSLTNIDEIFEKVAEKQGEQKFVDKCKDCNNVEGCITCTDGDQYAHITEQKPTDKVKPKKELKKIEQKPAWSEEDNDNMIMIEDRLSDYLDYIRVDRTLTNRQKNFLKEKVIGYVNWLKSLKEKYTWKPSEEQMRALNYVVNLMASSESPTENDYYYNVFKAMRTQLKKLKEE